MTQTVPSGQSSFTVKDDSGNALGTVVKTATGFVALTPNGISAGAFSTMAAAVQALGG
jgi:hypothetical protein